MRAGPPEIPTAIPTAIPSGIPLPPGADKLLAELLKGNLPGGFFPGSTGPGGLGPILWGQLLPPVPGGPLALAREFLSRFGTLFGAPPDIGALADLSRFGEIIQRGTQSITILPKLDRVPFPGGQLHFQFAPDGSLTGVSGLLRKLENPLKGTLDPGSAVRRAIEEMSRKYPQAPLTGGGDVQEFFARNAGGVLEHMYQVDLILGTAPRQIRVLLDSKGAPITDLDVTLSGIPDAKVYVAYPRAIVEWRDLRWLKPGYDMYDLHPMLGWKLKSQILDDDHHPYNHNLDGHFRADPFLWAGASPQATFMAQTCYYHLSLGIAWAWYWGMPHWPGTPLKFEVSGHQSLQDGTWVQIMNNATFLRGRDPWMIGDHWGRIVYATNNAGLTTSMAVDASFTYHELAHGIHWLLNNQFDTMSQGVEAGVEAIAVAEGVADAFSALVANHPTLGAIARDRSKPYYERNCAVPPATTLQYWQVRPCWMRNQPPGTPAAGEVHVAGQVISSAFWEIYLRKRDRHYTGRLLIRALQRAIAPHTMVNFVQGVLAADRDPDIGNGANVAMIQGIFRSKGFPGI
jgi:hypothetical protein